MLPLLRLIDTEKKRSVARIATAVVAGALVAWLAIPAAPEGVDPREPPPRVRLGPIDVAWGPDPERAALEAVRKWTAGSMTIVVPATGGGAPDRRTVPRSALGVVIDRARLGAAIGAARDPSSPMRRAMRRAGRRAAVLPLPVALDPEAAVAAIVAQKDEIDRPAQSARLDLGSRHVVPEQPGRRLDVHATLARVDRAIGEGRDEVEAVVEPLEPKMRAARLGAVSVADVLGWFETRHATDRKHEARTYNLRLAASRLDGHVLLPGETFDFNDVVGPRDEANGYKVAPVIAEGELVDGIGGGTCQISGTLYAAALFAGLDVVERRPHTRPSFYIKMGLDATVAYPAITLRLRNPFDHPVVLHETVQAGIVRAEVLGPKRTRTVTFLRRIDEALPFAEVERPDPKLPQGVRALAQRGIPGFRLHRYRVVRDGPHAVRERWVETYPPVVQIFRVGTGDVPKDSVVPQDDPHPEYVADEFLVLMQGPEVRTRADPAGGGMTEAREAGRTGERGWTERAGFSHWSAGRNDADCADCAGTSRAGGGDRDAGQSGVPDEGDRRAGKRRR